MDKRLNPEYVPYARFRFLGNIIELDKRQVDQCLADAKVCRCGDTVTCLVCRVKEYVGENR